ncbi:NAD(P)-binding domain-containing protein [Rhizobium sp. KVB221]|uniref:NAD(P)-binding domain-containing protein n=1 Tax=Rhizobium setariae TaxID=2801340 RepID=A0A936YSJ5_9HYPH|nr:pyrroline-5-carboxylate reductase [Rhizobium setariae]MBL0373961.1 NAD(P)-binding domain-containing protein [Rhizobium setariae]
MKRDPKELTLGFIGTGTITEAVVTGLSKTEFRNTRIVLSPRSDSVATRLSATYENVEVATDNQDVVDKADLVFVAVRLQIVEEVVRALRFRPGHHVVSFVAATPLPRLAEWIGQSVRLSQAIPLPFVANLHGATAIFPPDDVAAAIFAPLGTAVQVESKRQYDLIAAASSLMGTYFGILEITSSWMEKRGLPRSAADAYLRGLFAGLGDVTSSRDDICFKELIADHSTVGGTNEQVFRHFSSDGGTDAVVNALDDVLARIEGAATSSVG